MSSLSDQPLGPRVGREFVAVALALVLLEVIVFRDFFSGAVIPGWDFVSAYNFEAYAWWHDGSFFDPPQWMPYLWGGYPAVSNLQNASFYLPVGIASAFAPYTLHAAGIVTALHVALGAVGAYVFARRFGAGMLASLLALAAWFFAAGFTSNAAHLDIARAYAWIPWIMLVTSTRWPWRWYTVPLALLVLSQAILGIYPGMLVAIVYCIAGWIIVQQATRRPRLGTYLVPLAAVATAALLTTLVRFLPALLERGSASYAPEDLSVFGLRTIGNVLFPYDLAVYGGLIPFVSYFLPASILAALAFVGRPSRPMLWLAVPVGISVVLGLPFWPWHDVVRLLPGLNLSRFMASDFKVVTLFGLTMIGALIIDRLATRVVERPLLEDARPWRRLLRHPATVPALLLVALLVGLAIIGMRYGFRVDASIAQWSVLAVCSALALALAVSPRVGVRRAVIVGLLGATVLSGTIGAYAVPGTWRVDRLAVERSDLGATVDELIGEREPVGDQRPARVAPPPADQVQNNLDSHYSAGFYSGEPSLYGYVNLRATQSFEVVRAGVDPSNPTAVEARTFWSVAGMVIEADASQPPSESASRACSTSGDCGPDLSTEPIAYPSAERIEYSVRVQSPVTASINEAWYAGWGAVICRADDASECQTVPTRRGDYGQIVLELPAGDWHLHLEYRLPGLGVAWALFWVGILIAASVALVPLLLRRLRRPASARGGTGAAAGRVSP